MQRTKSILILALLAGLIFPAIQLNLFSRQARIQGEATLENTAKASEQLKEAAREARLTLEAIKTSAEAQRRLIEDPKNQANLSLLLRKLDNIARTIDKVNHALDQVNDDVLPGVTATLISARGTLDETTAAIGRLSSKGELTLDESNQTIRELRALLQSEDIKRTLAGLAEVAENTRSTTLHIEATADQVAQALPELIAGLKNIEANTDRSTREIADYLGTFNKKPTLKQKIWRAIITSLSIGAPILLKAR